MVTEIASTSNERIKAVRSLNQKKRRDETGLFLACGEKLVREAVACAPDAVTQIIATERYVHEFSWMACELIKVPDFIIESVSDQKTPQGVAAVIDRTRLPGGDSDRVLILDGVSDPANVGAMIRSADAFNFRRAVLSGCADVYSPKAVRASMGSVFRVPVTETDDLAAEITELKKRGFGVYATALDGERVSDAPEKLAVIIGSEAHGIGEVSRENADRLMKIPIPGGAESLNAAVAAGIAMYIFTQR